MPVPGNLFSLPDVPLPKMRDLLSIVARPPQRSPRPQNGAGHQTYHSYESADATPLSTPVTEDRSFLADQDLGYETITSAKAPVQRDPTPPPPPPQVEPEDDQFGLADQIRGTPERSLKGKKKKNRRSQDVETEDVPPPLPPKKLSPSPKKSHLMESQPSVEEEEIEAIPVKVSININININIQNQ